MLDLKKFPRRLAGPSSPVVPASIRRNALVLLSGGLDSVAALHWALDTYAGAEVRAIAFDYSQPHRVELAISQLVADRRAVPWQCEIVPGLGRLDPTAGREPGGVSRAFVPGRNGIFLWHAANAASRLWPGGFATLVMGCNVDDAAGFPDCRSQWIDHMNYAIGEGLAGALDLSVTAPWAQRRKSEIVAWCANRPDAISDVRASVSCYRGTRCGQCDACATRATAFASVGVEDGAGLVVKECGGDPAREAAFK